MAQGKKNQMGSSRPKRRRGIPHQSNPRNSPQGNPRKTPNHPVLHAFTLIGIGMAITTLGAILIYPKVNTGGALLQVTPGPAGNPVVQPVSFNPASRDSFASLATLPPDEIEGIDIARLNLLAAQGLPGAEDLNVETQLATLDRWADHVRFETERHLYKFRDHPEEYENSEPYFRMLMLIVAMQADLGVHYNAERINEPDFTNSQDLFLHGMIPPAPGSIAGVIPGINQQPPETNGGTCVSMPVLYVAVGRRLGYPLKLAITKGHVFARWDAPDHPNPNYRARINLEGTNRGLSTPDDEHYANWPYVLTEEELAVASGGGGWYLKSLTSAEELAIFLMQRGHCLEDTGRLHDAQVAYALAHRLAPKSPEGLDYLVDIIRLEKRGTGKAVVRASIDPESLMDLKRDASRREWLKRQPQWSDNYIRDLMREQARQAQQRPSGGRSLPGFPGIPGVPGDGNPGSPRIPVPGFPGNQVVPGGRP